MSLEGGIGCSRKTSQEERSGRLGIDRRHANPTHEPEQIQASLEVGDEAGFKGRNREEAYGWVKQTLRQPRFEELKRRARGRVRRYLEKMTGLSRAQTTRPIGLYRQSGAVQPKPYRRHRFPRRYRREDIELPAAMDETHETLSGPATQKLLQRAYYDFQDAPHKRLAQLPVAQLYRPRQSRRYRERRMVYRPTRPAKVSSAERRRPEPNGSPGYPRVDTVHQGDGEGSKGVSLVSRTALSPIEWPS
jgi:hypothetical protein